MRKFIMTSSIISIIVFSHIYLLITPLPLSTLLVSLLLLHHICIYIYIVKSGLCMTEAHSICPSSLLYSFLSPHPPSFSSPLSVCTVSFGFYVIQSWVHKQLISIQLGLIIHSLLRDWQRTWCNEVKHTISALNTRVGSRRSYGYSSYRRICDSEETLLPRMWMNKQYIPNAGKSTKNYTFCGWFRA